jgi:ABC-2 type transport system ATP-binding protein
VALLGDPQVLILDEPGNGLDPEGIAWLRAFLRGFARQGRSVLVSSHLLAEMDQTADHLVVISRGRCVYQGALAALRGSRRARVLVRCAAPVRLAEALARTGVLEIDTLPDGRLGIAGADPVRVGDVALAAGVAVYGMVEEKIDLEQLFFQLTTGQWRA